MEIENTLKNRHSCYGNFESQAEISQNIKKAMKASANWNNLYPEMREALEMIANKISRILNGDFTHIDSWHDIAGYAKLIEQKLD